MGDWSEELYKTIFQKNKLVRFIAVTLLVYLFFRYIFTLTAPFILAFVLITLFYPMLQRIQKKIPMRKKFLAVGVIFFFMLFLALIVWILGYNSSGQLDHITEFIYSVGDQMELFLHKWCYSLDGKFGWKGYEIENYLVDKMTIVMENVQVEIIPQVILSSYNCFKGLFRSVTFLFITLIAAILLEKDYAAFRNWLQSSQGISFLWKTLDGILSYLVTFFKAQGIILLVISILCSITLCIAGISGGVFWGILAGILDMFPFIGTGIVLVPIAAWQFINGNYLQMIVCLVVYVVCIFVREFLEPKLIGNHLGIAPVLMLLAIYVGIQLFGIGGILKGPLAMIAIYELMKEEPKSGDKEERNGSINEKETGKNAVLRNS